MLPVTLRIQAFASYAESVEIDFRKLDSLFLIHGATGSGKTAILDAMMYALYGKSSGDGRSTFRCALPAAEKLPTEVEFVFRSGDKLYKFIRSIRLTRSGKEDSKHDCFVFDEKEGQFRAVFENPTQTKVNDEAKRIIGLDADQFRQVVIIPQGQFERLLTSKSEDKEKTLSTLFAADKYSRISARLSEKASRMRSEIELEDTALKALLASEGVESISGLRDEKEALDREISGLVPLAEKAGQDLSLIRERLTEAEILEEKYSAAFSTENELSILERQADRIASLKASLAKNSEAMKLYPLYSEAISASDALKTRKSRFLAAKQSSDDAKKEYLNKAESCRVVAEGEDVYRSQLSEIAVLSGLSGVYDRISLAESKSVRIGKELSDIVKSCSMLDEAIEKNTSEIAVLEKERAEIHSNYSVVLPDLLSRKKALQEGAEAEKKIIIYTDARERICSDAARLKKEAEALDEQKASAEKEYDRVYSLFIINTAAELSSSLKEGMPCPVCGSKEHPCPAETSDSTITAEAVKKAKETFENLFEASSQKHIELSRQENRIPDADNHIAEQLQIINDCGYSADELKRVAEKADLAQKKVNSLTELQERIAQISQQQLELKEKSDSMRLRRDELHNDMLTASAEADTLRKQLDKRYPDIASFKEGMTRLTTETERYEAKKRESDEAMKTAEHRRIEAEAALKQAENELSEAQESCDKAEEELLRMLSKTGFASVDKYRTALLSESTVAEYTAETERYELDRHSLSNRLAQLRAELEGKQKPETDLLRDELGKAQSAFAEISARLSVAKQRNERLRGLIEELSVRFAECEKQREKSDKLSAYARFMLGSRGISFTRYILGIILGLVVEEANSILSGVHGGRFRLCIKTDIASNSKQGLDLEVENLTDEGNAKYSVKDLSGGEKFLISLALSLGLSSVAQSRSGGIRIDAMFIDEGFGSLDTNLLREAVGILCGLTSERSTIGIISHVSELKSVIPCGISVAKDRDGCSKILSTV